MTFSLKDYAESGKRIDFDEVNRAALIYLPSLVRTWCPQGYLRGREWVALNPTRPDKAPGSFSVNLGTGRWADFATGDKGGDVVSLAAYLFSTSQVEAARTLAVTLGVRA
jgi:hypothetical protein